MSDGSINFPVRSSAPSAPAVGRVKTWIDQATGEARYTDSNGNTYSAVSNSTIESVVNSLLGVFGTQYRRAFFTNNVSFSTTVSFEIYQQQINELDTPPGEYRIMIHYAYEPGSTGSNDHSEIRVNGSTANIEQRTFEDEGKDVGNDIMRLNILLGYYTKTTTGPFNIEMYARNEGGTTVIKGATFESWRVA